MGARNLGVLLALIAMTLGSVAAASETIGDDQLGRPSLGTTQLADTKQKTEGSKQGDDDCHPSYSPCLDANASDYDCAGGSGNGPYYIGPVRVIGPDAFKLDTDGDGWGCE